jgi:hypothetical protein
MVYKGVRLPALENPDDGLHRRDYYSRSPALQATQVGAGQKSSPLNLSAAIRGEPRLNAASIRRRCVAAKKELRKIRRQRGSATMIGIMRHRETGYYE